MVWDNDLGTWAIIAIVSCSVIMVAAIIVALLCCKLKGNKSKTTIEQHDTAHEQVGLVSEEGEK